MTVCTSVPADAKPKETQQRMPANPCERTPATAAPLHTNEQRRLWHEATERVEATFLAW